MIQCRGDEKLGTAVLLCDSSARDQPHAGHAGRVIQYICLECGLYTAGTVAAWPTCVVCVECKLNRTLKKEVRYIRHQHTTARHTFVSAFSGVLTTV